MAKKITERTIKSWLKNGHDYTAKKIEQRLEEGDVITCTSMEYTDFGRFEYTFKSGKKYTI